jgi:hypothetical protein
VLLSLLSLMLLLLPLVVVLAAVEMPVEARLEHFVGDR